MSTPLKDGHSPATASPAGDKPPEVRRAHALRVGGALDQRGARGRQPYAASTMAQRPWRSEEQPVGYMLVVCVAMGMVRSQRLCRVLITRARLAAAARWRRWGGGGLTSKHHHTCARGEHSD